MKNTKTTKKPTKTVTIHKKDWYALRKRKGGLYLFHPVTRHFLEDPACAYRFNTRQEAEDIIGKEGWEIVRITVTERKTMTITTIAPVKTETSKSSKKKTKR